jgi:hypothetical protein
MLSANFGNSFYHENDDGSMMIMSYTRCPNGGEYWMEIEYKDGIATVVDEMSTGPDM